MLRAFQNQPTASSDIIFDQAGVAQLVEQLIRNEKVDSSIPSIGTKNSYAELLCKSFFLQKYHLQLGAHERALTVSLLQIQKSQIFD